VKRTTRFSVAAGMLTILGLGLLAPGALAAQAEPFVSTTAWYWEQQQSQKVTDPTSGAEVATLELANPFCPTVPGGLGSPPGDSCRVGRLPIEVIANDYEEPDKISAVAFDLSLIPLGSTVKKFTATFLEANDPQSQPVNPEDKMLQACVIEQFFGEGDARQYKEAPRHTCTDLDPIAQRKEAKVKNADGEEEDRFTYTFDLTTFAQTWVEGASPVTGVMLYPAKPKEDAQGPEDADWRVVLAGPAEENGVVTNLIYTPGEVPTFGGDLGGDLGGSDLGGDSGFDTGSTGFDTGTTSGGTVGGTTATDPAAETPEGAGDPVAAPGTELAGDELTPTAGGLPGYVWLALLAGMIGFSLVRSIVLEQAAGIRPDGVLAQIRKLNIDKRGAALVAGGASGSRFGGVISGLKGLAGKATSLSDKLPFKRKA
jgi:hypothetical protein